MVIPYLGWLAFDDLISGILFVEGWQNHADMDNPSLPLPSPSPPSPPSPPSAPSSQKEQASWVCECEETLVARLEQDFKSTLQQQNSLEQWATWLESVVNTVLEPYGGGNQFTKAARQFLLKWSFYRYTMYMYSPTKQSIYMCIRRGEDSWMGF